MMKDHQMYVIETEDGLKQLDGPPQEAPRVAVGPRTTEAPQPKRKAREVTHGASDQT